MPRQNRTGPSGQGSRTGRGQGICNTGHLGKDNQRRGLRNRRGFGNGGAGNYENDQHLDKHKLEQYISDIEEELSEAKKILEDFDKSNCE